VQVVGAVWQAVTRIVVGVEDMVQRTRDGRTGRGTRWSDDREAGDNVCGLHRACGDEERGFLG
jgi:hypothetical protein